MELSSLKGEKFIVPIEETNSIDEINNFYMDNYWNKLGIFVKLIWKVSMRWKNWRNFKAPRSTQSRGQNWSKIEVLSLNSRPEFRNYRMKLIVWMVREIFKMLNQYAVHNPTLPVNQCFSHLFRYLKGCWDILAYRRAAKKGRQVSGTRMVYRETFLQIQRRLLQHLIRKSQILGSLMYQNTHHHMWWVKAKHQFTTSYGSYAMDQRSGVGWFSEWSKIFVLFERNSNAKLWSTRCEDRFSTESSITPRSKERSVWRNKKPKKRTVSFVEDRSLTWSTSTSGSLEPMILSRIVPTYSLLLFEMMIFRNSIQNWTEFSSRWQKFHLMTSWKDCTN